MKYMGSKNRIAKYILPIILEDRKPGQWYVEPFVGGANIIDKVDGLRIGNDINEYLIAVLKAVAAGWKPPQKLSEQQYRDIRCNKHKYQKELVGFVGFACSYAAKWFGGYCRGKTNKGVSRDYIGEAYRNVMKQADNLKGICFYNVEYNKLVFPPNSIVYCDPPYKGTTEYKNSFNHDGFFNWCRRKSILGHDVFVSEYSAPADFECIWHKKINSSLTKETGSKKGIEKLFTI